MLARVLEEEKVSPTELARRMKVTPQQVNDWLNRANVVTLRNLLRIAVGLGRPVDDLIRGLNTEYDAGRDLIRQGAKINQKPSTEGGSPDVDDATVVLLEALRNEHAEFRSQIEEHVRALLDAVRDDGRREAAADPPREAAAGEGNL